MSVYLKQFETHAEYEAAESSLILPNVSICEDTKDVHYNPYIPPQPLIAIFNVTSTSSPTRIASATTGFSEIEIDGSKQPSVTTGYTFDTVGEHTVKYTLTDPTSIGSHAFYRCYSLTSIDIPSGVTSIGDYAFYECTSLTSINIHDGVTFIGNSAFKSCSGLTSITIPDSVTSIEYSAFMVCTSLSSVTIPNSVTSIRDYAFSYCYGLTSVTISDSITSIGNNVFEGSSGLTSIDIPNGVTSIGISAFNYCKSLTSCTIGSGVTSISNYAFRECSSLTSITCNAATAPTIRSDTFQSVKTNGTLYVPIGSSGYDTWMQNTNYYLGSRNWTKVEQ